MENTKEGPIILGNLDGNCVSIQGGTYRILISGKDTNGSFATIDMLIPPGGGPGPHAHAAIRESFFVVEGTVEFRSEKGTYTAEKGSYVDIPEGGLVHCFKNKTDQPARLLCTVFPSGLDEFFLAIGQPVTPGTFLPKPVMDAALTAKLKALGEQFGQAFFPPDYLDHLPVQ